MTIQQFYEECRPLTEEQIAAKIKELMEKCQMPGLEPAE
jgi:galactose-1-phosphate uridylyltransferase